MTYEETEFELVSVATAKAECGEHGATAYDLDDELAIFGPGSGPGGIDHWGSVRIYRDGQVNARAVLSVLGY